MRNRVLLPFIGFMSLFLAPCSFSYYTYTMTITQTVEIPADRRITIEVPREVPTGTTARFELIWFPVKKTDGNLDATIDKIQTLCKDAPITVDSFLEDRRRDNERDEIQYRQFLIGFGAAH